MNANFNLYESLYILSINDFLILVQDVFLYLDATLIRTMY